MKTLVLRLVGRASDLAQTQPLLALCLGAALFAVLISLLLRKPAAVETKTSLVWTLYFQLSRFLFAAAVVLLLAQTLGVLRTYLRKSVAQFQQTHGRVTAANYNAVQTIWGSEQTQRELTLTLLNDMPVMPQVGHLRQESTAWTTASTPNAEVNVVLGRLSSAATWT